MQCFSRSLRIKNPGAKDLFPDIAAEELEHLEMVATAINQLNGHAPDVQNAAIGNVEAHVLSGLTPMLANASSYLWTAALYCKRPGSTRLRPVSQAPPGLKKFPESKYVLPAAGIYIICGPEE